jgi:hypothetical protein
MALRNNLPPPHFRPPRLRSIRGVGGSSTPVDVDVEATSIDANEYLAGLHDIPRGDDDKDLGAADLIGARARSVLMMVAMGMFLNFFYHFLSSYMNLHLSCLVFTIPLLD